MKNLLLSLKSELKNINESLAKATEATKGILTNLIDNVETQITLIEVGMKKGSDETKIEKQISYLVDLHKEYDAEMLEATSGQLPNRINDLIVSSLELILGDVPLGEGLSVTVTIKRDRSVTVSKARKYNPNAVGSGSGAKGKSGNEVYIIDGKEYESGSAAYKALATKFGNDATKFKEGTGRTMKATDGSISFSAPAELKPISVSHPTLVSIKAKEVAPVELDDLQKGLKSDKMAETAKQIIEGEGDPS